jgi:hypothetical protein
MVIDANNVHIGFALSTYLERYLEAERWPAMGVEYWRRRRRSAAFSIS